VVKYYPRGEKELRGPFHQFSSGDTINGLKTWRGTKIGRRTDVSVSNSSNNIECFLTAYSKMGGLDRTKRNYSRRDSMENRNTKRNYLVEN
jgi:hypothetical protein